MNVVRIACVVSVLLSGVSASACEHCRIAAVSAAQIEMKQRDPVQGMVDALETAGKELRAALAARKKLAAHGKAVWSTRSEMIAERDQIQVSLEILRNHVQAEEFPVLVGKESIADVESARRCASGLLLRMDTLEGGIRLIEEEVAAGDREVEQLTARIDHLQTEILLAEHRATRLLADRVPRKSDAMLGAVRRALPAGPKATKTHRERVADFLNAGAPIVKPNAVTADGGDDTASTVR